MMDGLMDRKILPQDQPDKGAGLIAILFLSLCLWPMVWELASAILQYLKALLPVICAKAVSITRLMRHWGSPPLGAAHSPAAIAGDCNLRTVRAREAFVSYHLLCSCRLTA
jgi:hypothetical protein